MGSKGMARGPPPQQQRQWRRGVPQQQQQPWGHGGWSSQRQYQQPGGGGEWSYAQQQQPPRPPPWHNGGGNQEVPWDFNSWFSYNLSRFGPYPEGPPPQQQQQQQPSRVLPPRKASGGAAASATPSAGNGGDGNHGNVQQSSGAHFEQQSAPATSQGVRVAQQPVASAPSSAGRHVTFEDAPGDGYDSDFGSDWNAYVMQQYPEGDQHALPLHLPFGGAGGVDGSGASDHFVNRNLIPGLRDCLLSCQELRPPMVITTAGLRCVYGTATGELPCVGVDTDGVERNISEDLYSGDDSDSNSSVHNGDDGDSEGSDAEMDEDPIEPDGQGTLLCIAASKELHVEHLDVKTAFLNAPVEEGVWMYQAPGFEENDLVTGKTQGPLELVGFTDNDFTGKLESRRSCTGSIFMLRGGVISSASVLQ
eukprot:g18488.t1